MIYMKYFKYVLEHKKNVFIECVKMAKEYWSKPYWRKDNRKIARQLFIHAFTHDLSKFSLKEFIPYAKYFYGGKEAGEEYKLTGNYLGCKEQFNNAWQHHYKVNKHHPEHWIDKNMPMKYIRFMVCDLKAMSKKFGGTAQEYYLQNYYKWDITHETRHRLEIALDLINEYNAPICECSEEYYMNIDELIKSAEDFYNKNGYIRYETVEDNINNLLKHTCDTYKVNIYKLVKESKNKIMRNE